MSNSSSFADSLRQQLQDRLVRRALIVAGVAGVVLFFGLIYYWQHSTAWGQSLNARYGRRSGRGADSVNGTSVLAHMFALRGFRVRTADRLSPKLRKSADVIVWAPDSFHPPTKKHREYLERWLSDGDGRTLIYIGRDYDAAAAYWKSVAPSASGEDAKKMAELADRAQKSHELSRGSMPSKEYARWFTVKGQGTGDREQGTGDRGQETGDRGQKPPLTTHHSPLTTTVKELSGPWAEGIDAAKADISLHGRLDLPVEADATGEGDPLPPDDVEPLLVARGDPLAFRLRDFAWDDGQVIVVANGSFLLNYPLINPQHRKLAARLIDECGGSEAIFLESGPAGPEILEKDPPQTGGLAMLRIWPLNAMVIHLTVFGIVLCLAYWPIFGRPKELPGENPADFGRHVTSLGQLMARTKNLAYAQSRLVQYQQQARRGSGTSHRK
ncbi:MAG TPA: DUF4350 domain-containing protein [Pirellulaceae bacterium]|nr:DUF4350 domain-containing protein [Pirellulaceae bacterium]